MADIIPLDNKRQSVEETKAAKLRERKIRAVQSVILHTRNAPRCEKCGVLIKTAGESVPESFGLRVPYRFCRGCSEEYTDYIECLKGDANPSHFWQQDEWLQAWTRWIDYQGTVDRYLKSSAFKALLDDLRSNRPEE
ncbi:MAG: hypothetical protein ABIL58_15660 [Pseudomonadota bacterium]